MVSLGTIVKSRKKETPRPSRETCAKVEGDLNSVLKGTLPPIVSMLMLWNRGGERLLNGESK